MRYYLPLNEAVVAYKGDTATLCRDCRSVVGYHNMNGMNVLETAEEYDLCCDECGLDLWRVAVNTVARGAR